MDNNIPKIRGPRILRIPKSLTDSIPPSLSSREPSVSASIPVTLGLTYREAMRHLKADVPLMMGEANAIALKVAVDRDPRYRNYTLNLVNIPLEKDLLVVLDKKNARNYIPSIEYGELH